MPEHDLLILGETEVALQSVGAILLHSALKRRHGVLNGKTGGATMANHQQWGGRVPSDSTPGITTYDLKEPCREQLERVKHTTGARPYAAGYPAPPR